MWIQFLLENSNKFSTIGAEIVEGDLFSFDSLKSALERVEVVIHLASNVDFYPKKTEDLYKINVEGTRNLVRASEAAGIRRFIYISSTEVCAPTGNEIANEDTPMRYSLNYWKIYALLFILSLVQILTMAKAKF